MPYITMSDILEGQEHAGYASPEIYRMFEREPASIANAYETLHRAAAEVDALITRKLPYLDDDTTKFLAARMQEHVMRNLRMLKMSAEAVQAGATMTQQHFPTQQSLRAH